MREIKPAPIGGVWPTVNPSVNGGASATITACVFQSIDTIKFSSDANQVPITENLQISENTEKVARDHKWDFEEDMALMSAWCIASKDQDHRENKKQRRPSFWARVKELYEEARAKSSKKLGPRNDNQMRGRWKRLNENAIKWIDAYRKAYKLKTSEMSLKDIENEAHKIYAACGSMYNDLIVFNEVMCKHPKWELHKHRDTTCSCREYEVGNDESGGSSTKRTRISEEEEDCVHLNQEMSDSDGSTIHRSTGRDASEKKRKCKASESSFRNEYFAELRAMRIIRDSEVEVMRKRLSFEERKEKRKGKKEKRKSKKVHHMHLNTLLAKEHLSPEDKDMKHHLLEMLYGK